MPKAEVAIVTDSTCNLPDELVEKHAIHVIPQILNWDGESLYDGIDITPEHFYERLARSKTVPTTSQASAGEFLEFFKRVSEGAESIVAILVSSELSGTLDSARTAAKMLEDLPLEIVDSRSTSMGLGLMVLEAARAAARGLDYKEVAETVRSLVPKVRVLFVVDTLEYLHKGGRIGGAQRLVGSMLAMKPVLSLVDGRIETQAKIRTKSKAIAHLIEIVHGDLAGKENVHASIIAAAATEQATHIYDRLREVVQPVEFAMAELTPVVGTHAGPGTVGIAYYVE